MSEMIPRQLGIFAAACAYGAQVAVWYDLFRVFRRRLAHRELWVHMEDIFYTFTVAGGLFRLFLQYNYGSFRLYILLGAASGVLAYCLLLHPYVEKGLDLILWLLLSFLHFFGFIFIAPVKFMINSSVKALKKAGRTVRIMKSRI